jgi:hypothetical protein
MSTPSTQFARWHGIARETTPGTWDQAGFENLRQQF